MKNKNISKIVTDTKNNNLDTPILSDIFDLSDLSDAEKKNKIKNQPTNVNKVKNEVKNNQPANMNKLRILNQPFENKAILKITDDMTKKKCMTRLRISNNNYKKCVYVKPIEKKTDETIALEKLKKKLRIKK